MEDEKHFVDRLKESVIRMKKLAEASKGLPNMVTFHEEAAQLLLLTHAMMTDPRPLTNWDMIHTRLHKAIVPQGQPSAQQLEQIETIKVLLREVSGEKDAP